MGKKRSSKNATAVLALEKSGEAEEIPSSTSKKAGNEIDEIFAGKKRKKPGKGVKEGREKAANLNKNSNKKDNENKKMSTRKAPKENGSAETPSRSRKRAGDGLTIYTEDELGIGNSNAGGTPLCPFDCDCCF